MALRSAGRRLISSNPVSGESDSCGRFYLRPNDLADISFGLIGLFNTTAFMRSDPNGGSFCLAPSTTLTSQCFQQFGASAFRGRALSAQS